LAFSFTVNGEAMPTKNLRERAALDKDARSEACDKKSDVQQYMQGGPKK